MGEVFGFLVVLCMIVGFVAMTLSVLCREPEGGDDVPQR